MPHLEHIDLYQDPAARAYVKNETVQVCFASTPGELMSREGPNRYQIHDAIITGSTGDRWCVSRDRFDAKYEALAPNKPGQDGAYRNKPIPILAKQMHTEFSLARSTGGDILYGKPNDWVVQYAPGDYGLVENTRFMQVYRAVAN